MKIALVSDDELTICRHFGRAKNYIVVLIENEKLVARTTLPKPVNCHSNSRHHGALGRRSNPEGKGFGHQAKDTHEHMFEGIKDCDILVTRGMGRGAYLDLQKLGVKPIVTDIAEIEMAIDAILEETIVNHTEKLH